VNLGVSLDLIAEVIPMTDWTSPCILTLAELFERIDEAVARQDDSLILDVYLRFLPTFNAMEGAGFYLGAAGYICHHRPHLAEQVLGRPVACLFALGVDTVERVLACVDPGVWNLLDASGPNQEGYHWLRVELPFHRDFIQRELDRLVQELGE
jgi:hypothetical protein